MAPRAPIALAHGDIRIYLDSPSFLPEVLASLRMAPASDFVAIDSHPLSKLGCEGHGKADMQHPVVQTAFAAQCLFAVHASDNFSTLAQALRAYHLLLPTALRRKLDRLNKAASVIRHSAGVDKQLLHEIEDALADLPPGCKTRRLAEDGSRDVDTEANTTAGTGEDSDELCTKIIRCDCGVGELLGEVDPHRAADAELRDQAVPADRAADGCALREDQEEPGTAASPRSADDDL